VRGTLCCVYSIMALAWAQYNSSKSYSIPYIRHRRYCFKKKKNSRASCDNKSNAQESVLSGGRSSVTFKKKNHTHPFPFNFVRTMFSSAAADKWRPPQHRYSPFVSLSAHAFVKISLISRESAGNPEQGVWVVIHSKTQRRDTY